MTNYVLSIDPGLSSGVTLLSYEDDSPAQLVKGWQFTGGVAGLIQWVEGYYRTPSWGWQFEPGGRPYLPVKIIAEKFTARATKGFSYTTASLEALRGEGALIALGLMPDYTVAEKRWRDPGLQYLVGGKDKADKKKRQHRFLKERGFYLTGGDLGQPNADDYRSAAAHGIAYISRELKHKPTFDMIAAWTERN